MKQLLLVFCTSIFLVNIGHSQINVQWESRYDGSGNSIDIVSDFEIDATGNTFVTGTSYNGSDFDVVTVKYDNQGNELWTNTYGTSGLDESKALTVDNNGDVIVTGAVYVSGSDWDIFTLKIDGSTGTQSWAMVKDDGGIDLYDVGNDVAVDADNHIYVTGSYNYSTTDLDHFVLKYHTNGTELHFVSNGGGYRDEGLLIQLDDDANVYIGGTREYDISTTYFDFRIMKYDSTLTQTWVQYEDSGYGNLDKPTSMTLDDLGNIYIAGEGFTDINNEEDYLVMKFNNAGTLQWKNTYAGDAEGIDRINAIVIDNSTYNLFVTGKIKTNDNAEDYLTIAYNSTGDTLWTRSFTTSGLNLDVATDITLSSTGYLYVTGYSYTSSTNNDYYTIKYDTSGNQEWATRFDGPASNSDQALRMRLDATENVYVSGTSHGGSSTNKDYSTIKYCQFETFAPNDTAICMGQSVQLTATSSGSNFNWFVVSGEAITAANFSCSTCAAPTASPSITTTYAVSSESAGGCVDYDTVTVTVNTIPTPTVYASGATTFCLGDSVTIYTDSYADYLWSNMATDSFTTVYSDGTYTVNITDTNGCQNSADIAISTWSLPTVDAGTNQTICPENTAQLSASGADSYEWTNDPTLSQLLIYNPVASPTALTTYYVTGTDANGCQNIDSVEVDLYTSPTVDAGSPVTICLNDSTQLSASGASTYVWNTDASMPITNTATPWVYPTGQTEYFVTGTDANGCTNIDSVTISTNNLPFVSAGVDQTICQADSVHIFATGALTYVWNTDPTLSNVNSSNPWADPITDTQYIVEGTDVNGCKNTDSMTVFVNALPNVNAGADDAVCEGGSIQLNASGAVSYTWVYHSSLSATNVSNPTASPVSATTYEVEGTDANGCSNTDQVTISINALPSISAGIDSGVCEGDSIQLNATGGVTYVWTYHSSLSEIVAADPWATPTALTTYTVQGTDANGCSNTAQVSIDVYPIPSAPTLSQSSNLLISSLADGNQWYLDGGLLSGETNDTLDYSQYSNGTYTVVYVDNNGCASDSTSVNATIFVDDVSTESFETSLTLNVYPNPARDVITLDADQQWIQEVTIYDLNGRLVYQENQINVHQHSIDLVNLPAGNYLIYVSTENERAVKKLIKL